MSFQQERLSWGVAVGDNQDETRTIAWKHMQEDFIPS